MHRININIASFHLNTIKIVFILDKICVVIEIKIIELKFNEVLNKSSIFHIICLKHFFSTNVMGE